jgi:hypothetical protein
MTATKENKSVCLFEYIYIWAGFMASFKKVYLQIVFNLQIHVSGNKPLICRYMYLQIFFSYMEALSTDTCT